MRGIDCSHPVPTYGAADELRELRRQSAIEEALDERRRAY